MASYQDRAGKRTITVRKQEKGNKFVKSKTLPINPRNIKILNEWASELEQRIEKDGLETVKEATAPLSIKDVMQMYLDHFDEQKNGERSIFYHLRKLIKYEKFLNTISATNLRADKLIEYAQQRKSHGRKNYGEFVSPAVINIDFSYIQKACRTMRTIKRLNINMSAFEEAREILQSEGIMGSPVKRKRRPSIKELNIILSYFQEAQERKNATVNMVDIILFAMFSGRRESEIVNLKWSNLDYRKKSVIVEKMKDPRNKKNNNVEVFLTEESWKIIQRQGKNGEYIFPYNAKMIGSKFYVACKMFGITDLRFHDLRHEFCSWCAERKIDVLTIMSMSGHKSLKNLSVYIHLNQRDYYDKYQNWEWRP